MTPAFQQVSILCPYWLINHTGLPLVFRAEGYSNLSASQYEEHEKASSSSPLLFSYPEEDLLRKCVYAAALFCLYQLHTLFCL